MSFSDQKPLSEHVRVLAPPRKAPHQRVNNYNQTVVFHESGTGTTDHPWVDARVRELEAQGATADRCFELRALKDASAAHHWTVICVRYSESQAVSFSAEFSVHGTIHEVERLLAANPDYTKTRRLIWTVRRDAAAV